MNRTIKKYMPLIIVLVIALSWTAYSLNVEQILTSAYDSSTGTLQLSVATGNNKDVTALTNTATYPLELQHETSGTPAAGIGVGLEFIQETSASNNETGAYIEAVVTDATATSEDFEFNLGLMAAGATASEVLSISSVGVATFVGGATLDNAAAATELVIAETNIQLTGALDLEGGNVKINEDSGDYDFAIETDSTDNAFSIDSGNSTLDVNGLTVSFNQGSADVDFKVEGNGVDPMLYVDAGNDRIGIGTATPDTQFESLYSGSSTNTVDNQFKISSLTSGSPANGIGTGMQFETESSASNYEVGLKIDSVTTDVTGSSEDFDFVISLMDGGSAAAERARVDSDGVLSQSTATYGSMYRWIYQADAMADDGTVNLPDATDGMVIAMCNAEAGFWIVNADGTVTKISGSTNTDAADTDAKLCVYDGGTNAVFKNRLGTTGACRVVYNYN